MVGDIQRVGTFLRKAAVADLKLPLARQHLGVDPVNHQARFETGPGVGLDGYPPEGHVGADAAVVRALRSGEAGGGEAERGAAAEQGVFLLEAKPRLVFRRAGGQHLAQVRPGIGGVGRAVRVEHLAQDQEVPGAAQGVSDEGRRLQDQIGVVAGGLVR